MDIVVLTISVGKRSSLLIKDYCNSTVVWISLISVF